MHRLEGVFIRQRLSQPSLCELTFRDAPQEAVDVLSVPGTPMSVEIEDFPGSVFSGEVTAVEYDYEPDRGQLLRVRGYELLHRLRKRQPVRVHQDIRLPGLASEMVSEFGFT